MKKKEAAENAGTRASVVGLRRVARRALFRRRALRILFGRHFPARGKNPYAARGNDARESRAEIFLDAGANRSGNARRGFFSGNERGRRRGVFPNEGRFGRERRLLRRRDGRFVDIRVAPGEIFVRGRRRGNALRRRKRFGGIRRGNGRRCDFLRRFRRGNVRRQVIFFFLRRREARRRARKFPESGNRRRASGSAPRPSAASLRNSRVRSDRISRRPRRR